MQNCTVYFEIFIFDEEQTVETTQVLDING